MDEVVGKDRVKRWRPYLQHYVGGIMPAVGRIKVARQTGCLAIRANVDVYRRTVDTMEARANNVLLTTASNIRERHRNIRGITHLKHRTSGCLRATKKGHWASIGNNSRAGTHIIRPHCRCHMFHRYRVHTGECTFAEEALPSVPRKGGSGGCCVRRCIRH